MENKTIKNFFYFKLAFLSISAGIFTALLAYGLFDLNFSNKEAITQLLFKSFATGVATGFVLGILNLFFKLGKPPS